MKAIGLISANYQGSKFGELTENRTLASLPYGGRYRLIDFALSNMANSGISTVGVIAPYNSGSLIDHIGEGRSWSLGRKSGGLFIMPGSIYGVQIAGSRFLMRDMLANKGFFERGEADCVIVTGSSDVCNIDFEPILKHHEASGKAVTMVYKKIPRGEKLQGFFLDIDESGKVTEIKNGGMGWSNYFMDCFIIDRKFMLNFLDWFKALEHMDMFQIMSDNMELMDIGAYDFKGYLGKINSAKDFLKVNQDMCDYVIRNEVFCNPDRPILTKTQDEAPAFFLPDSDVRNSIVSAGCRIEGTVENSIIFRSVNIGKGSVVRNCIIMMHGDIGENVLLDNVICDKYVTISDGVKIFGGDEENPIIIGKNNVL
jgi:glucose-1-phosphate adenylyltransferase